MITTTTNKISYISDGSTTSYDFNFPIAEASDIQVYIYDLNNNKTQLVYGIDYTVSLNSDNSGGTVTLTNPANKDYTILIYREVPYTQETVYTENSPFPAKSHEKALDKLTLLTQQLKEKFNRTLQYDPADEGQSVTLPPMVGGGFLGTTADKKLTWKANVDYSNINLKVNTISDLLNVDLTNWDGVQPFVVLVLGYHESGDGGGGLFFWDANEDKANHNGGTVIDPEKAFPSDWNDTSQQDVWFNTTNTGSGCWKRLYSVAVNVKWFGAKGDNSTDDTKSIQKTVNCCNKIYILSGNYIITDSINIDKSNIEIYAEKNAVIEVNTSNIAINVTSTNRIFRFKWIGGFIRSDSTNTTNNYFNIVNVSDFIIKDVRFANCDGYTIYISNSYFGTLQSLEIDSPYIGIGIVGGSTSIDINSIYIGGANTYGIYLGSCSIINITSFWSELNEATCKVIYFKGCSQVNIDTFWLGDNINGSTPIYFFNSGSEGYSHNITFNNGIIGGYNIANYGMEIRSSSNIIIKNVIFSSFVEAGILIGSYSLPDTKIINCNINSGNLVSSNNILLYQNDKIGFKTTSPLSDIEFNGSIGLKITTTGSDYTVEESDVVILTTQSSPITITLPSSIVVNGRIIIIKDMFGSAGTNNITIATENSETIDGQSTYVINSDYGKVKLIGRSGNWYII